MSKPVTSPTIAVIGCGYVGLTTAAILAQCGLTVHALETDQSRLESLRNGRSFFYEAGIEALLAAGLASRHLLPTDDYLQAIPQADIVFSCVGTPDNPDGSANLSYIFDAATKAAGLMKDGAIFVQKSTVPVGTGQKLQPLFHTRRRKLQYVSNPEFLREGTALSDTIWPDRVIAGSTDLAATQSVLDVYRYIEEHAGHLSAVLAVTPPEMIIKPRYITTDLASAELIKVSANAFLALKISFANSIAKLADQANADVVNVMDAVGADHRIGKAFLQAGRGYGGGCFPKDVSSLIHSAEEYGLDLAVMRAAADVNASMPQYIIDKALVAYGSPLQGVHVAVLGLAFKSGTSDTRRSPGIAIANLLAGLGAKVSAYDPQAMADTTGLHLSANRCDSTAQAIRDAELVFIATDWPEFADLIHDGLLDNCPVKVVVDCVNCLEPAQLSAGITYVGVGRQTPKRSA